MKAARALITAALIGMVGSGGGIGASTGLRLAAGHGRAQGIRPKPQSRQQAKNRLAAAEAKRQRRQARNLSWQARGGIGNAR